MDDMTLASHVHCLVLADEGEQETTNDEIGLEEEDWH